jgi:hypothetical protein
LEIAKLTVDNYSYTVLRFRERQAGVSAIYDPAHMSYTYNAYCLETKLLQDLFTCEYDFLEDAIFAINEEFGSWEIEDLSDQKGCGSCAAKKLN